MTSPLFLALLLEVSAHGTITKPAMRYNPSRAPYCPWCQGSRTGCVKDPKTCAPPKPCSGGIPGSAVHGKYFGKFKDAHGPDGQPWIDGGAGGQPQPVPVWCPGEGIPTHTLITADHNGIFRWESQLAAPGLETEKGFVNFTAWASVNQNPHADFYAEDGKTKLEPGRCYAPGRCREWTPTCSHCRNDVFSNTTFTLPLDMPAGQTVVRWIWFGARTVAGELLPAPEHSLFANCKDVVIGTPEQCKARHDGADDPEVAVVEAPADMVV